MEQNGSAYVPHLNIIFTIDKINKILIKMWYQNHIPLPRFNIIKVQLDWFLSFQHREAYSTTPTKVIYHERRRPYIYGLVQERWNSIANALELHLFCTSPLIYLTSLQCISVHRKMQKNAKLEAHPSPLTQAFKINEHNMWDFMQKLP